MVYSWKMSRSIFYHLFFWVIWLAVIPAILKVIPVGSELISMVIYSFIGLGLYFSISRFLTFRLDREYEKNYKGQIEKTKTREQFLREQRLIKKYRYIKLNIKENIIDSNIGAKDKTALLEIIHGYSPEDARQLIEKAVNK